MESLTRSPVQKHFSMAAVSRIKKLLSSRIIFVQQTIAFIYRIVLIR